MRAVRNLYLRGLGGVYLVAFTSLGAQVIGLYGERGIRPIRELLATIEKNVPPRERLRYAPTLFWFDASDGTLRAACRAGQVGAVLMMLGIRPRTTAAALWALYLSFVSVGRDFLWFQWDSLLLENGLHAIAIAPPSAKVAAIEEPSPLARTAMKWLAFRLQFESGHCKLASGDRAWRTGDACCVHFETQPLPTRPGWHAHQAPRWLKRVATWAAVGIELGAPFLAFGPRRIRHLGFGLLAGLQGLIALTGNYGFFNLLTLVDDLWLLDDASLPRWLARSAHSPGRRSRWWRRLGTALALSPLLAISVSTLASRVFRKFKIPRSIDRAADALAPLRSVNMYGLFAQMTMDRPEVVIEGSDDAVTWRPYSFRYKAGDESAPPRWSAPHMPRLDWQMWFAALGPAPIWFVRLLQRILEGSPDVLALFAKDPFEGRAPRYVRALLYDYHMTDRETRRRTGAWWRRELLGTYVPPLELRQFEELAAQH